MGPKVQLSYTPPDASKYDFPKSENGTSWRLGTLIFAESARLNANPTAENKITSPASACRDGLGGVRGSGLRFRICGTMQTPTE